MSKTSFTRKRSAPFTFSAEARARLEAMSEVDVAQAASGDPDNPILSDGQLRRMRTAREVRRVREATGLSQPQFAARYRIGLGRLRDFEQARSEPDLLLRVIYRLISEDPERAERLIAQVEREGLAGAA